MESRCMVLQATRPGLPGGGVRMLPRRRMGAQNMCLNDRTTG
jgi:hypothetical protein